MSLHDSLSTGGKGVSNVTAVAFMIPVLWGTFTNTGIPGSFNHFQASLFGGSYYPQFTLILLAIPCGIASLILGVLFDLVTGMRPTLPQFDENVVRPTNRTPETGIVADRREDLR